MDDWRSILDEHGPVVWRIVFRLVNDFDDAEDCFQEVFLAASTIAQREIVQDWSRLLRRLAHIRAVRRLRERYAPTSTSAQDVDGVEIPDDLPSPLDLAATAELADALRQALSRLPQQQAAAHCLRFQEGCSYQEIAEALDISSDNVGVLLNCARKRLSALLADYRGQSFT